MREPSGLFHFDPGWLWLLAGCALLAAAMILPAVDDVREAQQGLDVARALESHSAERLQQYAQYQMALEMPTPEFVQSLAMTHLNMAPEGTIAVLTDPVAQTEAGVFADLEPEFTPPPDRAAPASVLQRLIASERSRQALMAFALLAILYGVLPPAKEKEPEPEPSETELA